MHYKAIDDLKTYASKVEVRPSPIHGKGVFALDEIPKGVVVCLYKGILYPYGAHLNSDYRAHVNKDVVLDAAEVYSTGKYINSPYKTGKKANVQFGKFYPATILCEYPCFTIKTTRTLKPGEELLILYGQSYWTGDR